MKLASFLRDGHPRFGLALEDGLLDLTDRLAGRAGSVDDIIAAGFFGEIAPLACTERADVGFDEVHYRPPLEHPGKILCVGINYHSRPGEMARTEAPAYPSLFIRTRAAQVGHGEAIVRPHESVQLDYEGEIAIIIGRGGRRIPEASALAHIAGYACFNEGSVRDWMRHGVYNVTAGKNFDASGAFGPWLATSDEIADPHDMRITTRVNGATVQEDSSQNMIFPFERLIAYISTFSALEPGDVIATGTPTGAGAKRTPPSWLVPGDELEIEVQGVGVLRNRVIDEPG
jgi:2-keto-4-pentenoate hydratase/2-oxohepta-3-ene-1,7-dioic acid hydratase in catechol pathway